MSALKSACLAIVNSMSADDQQSVLTKLDQYLAMGVPQAQAQIMAVTDAMEELKAEQDEFMGLVAQQHPDLFAVQYSVKRAGDFTYTQEKTGRFAGRVQVFGDADRIRFLAKATPSKFDKDSVTFKAVDAANVIRTLKNQPRVDAAIAREIAELMKLTEQELAITNLEYQTGQPKDRAFVTPLVGGLPEVVKFLTERYKATGAPLLDIGVEADRAKLAKLIAAEALAAIRSSGSAVEWYDVTIARLLGMASLKYPELQNNLNAQSAFRVALAITSQGLDVETNLKFTMQVYEQFRSSAPSEAARRFPIVGQGESQGVMEKNFLLTNDMLSDMGPDFMRRFLKTPFTVSELNSAGFSPEGELVDEAVLGSSVLGPKIGFGFYSNLNGNFEPVTMDMWFMRTVGRLTGKISAFDQKKFDAQLARFRQGLDQTGSDGLYAASLDPALVAAARTDVDKAIELARVIKRAHEKDYKDNRAAFDSGRRVKTQIVLAADTMVFSLDKPTDVPQNGTERRLLRDVVKRTVALLEQHYGERVPPAALQALIWYPEQEFYKAMGVKLRVTSQDYAGAVQQLLKGEGYSESDLRSAAQSGSRRARQMAARAERSGSQAPGKGLGRFDALQDEERDNFLRQRYEREQLRQEAEDPKRKRVVFEVAPDPDNTKLSEAWNKLDEATRLEVSNAVARRIVPEVMREFETDGIITEQVGSFENDTNPSFSLLLKKGDPVEIARFMGFILSQKEMVVVSPKPFQGGSPVGAIAIEVGQLSTIEIDEIYQELRKITVDGKPVVGGQSTINGFMSVLNYSDVPTDQLAQLIDNQLLGAYSVKEDLVYATFPSKKEYDYASNENDGRGKRADLRSRARVLRGRVASVLQEELNRARRQSGGGARGRQGAGGKVPAQQPGAQEAGSGQDVQRSNRLSPLPGAPNVPGFHGPDPRLVAVAEQYARDNGIDLKRQSEYVKIDEDRAKRIAQAYEAMPNAPQDPAVREAYANLIQQTTTQYRALVDAGYKFWFVDLGRDDNIDYIDSPWNAMRDLRANQVLGVFPTDAGFGSGDKVRDNPLELTVTEYMWPVGDLNGPLKRVLANDLFRAVHDAFGHGLEGAGFRAQGEENAWQAHVRLFTGSAVGAITSETRGQNSAVNFGKNAEFNKTASAADTIYADQKVGLMPEWTWTEGRAGDINLTVAGFDNASGNFNPDLDPYWIKQGQKEINGERVSDADYYTAVAEYANQWRVQELLEKLGWVRRGSSNVSSSVYFEKSIELAEPNEDGQDSLTYEVRVSDHDDRYPADGTVEQRVQINFRSERADWADADITPDMSTADAVATLEDLLPFENSALGIQRSVRTDTPEFKAWFGDWDAVRKATMPREAATLSEAIERAASFVGKPILNISTGLEATVSRGNLGKMTSGSATLKSTSARAHALAVANADRLFTNALLESSSADKRGEPTIAAIRRYVAPMIDESGRLVAVKMTVKETTGPKEPNPLYTIETLEIAKPALEAPETGIERGIDSRRQPPQAGFTGTVAQMLTDSNPVTVSKVVDANGAPLVVYHGSSDKGIEVFESEDGRFYFTDNKAVADGYGRKKGERKNAQTYSVYLSMQRPDVYDMKGASWYKDGVASEVYGYIMDAKDAGFDGVILENFVDGATEQRSALSTIYVVFDPTQIKSIDNDGAWSTTNPNISRSARTPLGFYSALVRGIENLPTKQAEAGAWKAQIKGLVNKGLVKADEIEWSGVNDYLDLQKGKITKDAVMEYLSQNGVRVEEVVLGGKDLAGQWEQFKDGWRRKIGNRWMHVWEPDFEGKVYGKGPSGLTQKFASVEEGKAYFDGMDGTSSTQPAKYGKYQLPGGENYREVLLTLPPSSVVEPVVAEGRWRLRDKFTGEFMRADGAKVIGFNSEAEARKAIEQLSEPGMDQFVPGFNSRHWSQKNILAHIRVNDRVDADGKRVLFVEELQSDWSQDGRKKGFRGAPNQELDALSARMDKASEELRALQEEMKTKSSPDDLYDLLDKRNALRQELHSIDRKRSSLESQGVGRVSQAPFVAARRYAVFKDGRPLVTKNKDGKDVNHIYEKLEDAQAAASKHGGEFRDLGFQHNTSGWLNLALKRIMVMAAEGGYDKVAFVNGEQSADRYDLSQQVNYVQWNPGSLPGSRLISLEEKGGTIIGVSVQADGTVYDSSVDGAEGKRLDEVLGKEIAEKIMAEENGDLRGLDLKVGGRGMKTFYDSIVPAAIKKLLPKVGGGQMGMVTLDVAGLDQPTSFKGVREGGKGVVQGSMPNGNIVYLQQDETWGPRSTAKRFSYLDDAYDAAAALIGKVGRITQPGFDVTPAMREKVAEGLPQFSRRSDVAAAQEALELVRKARSYEPMEGEDRVVFPILYHSGTGDPDSLARGVEPQFGSWVAEVLADATDEEIDAEESFVPLSYYAGSPEWIRMQTARRIGKSSAQEVTLEDIRKSGQLAIVYNVDDRFGDAVNRVYQIGPDGYNGGYTEVIDVYGKKRKLYETGLEEGGDYRSQPKTLFGVEPGDIITNENITPDIVLTGDALIEFMRAYQAEIEPGFQFSRRQTDTPEFRRWFGDSKVVDANGEPLVVYHGTDAEDDFSVFDTMDFGSWFAENEYTSNGYTRKAGGAGSRVIPAVLKIDNPLRVPEDIDLSNDVTVEEALNRINDENGTTFEPSDLDYMPDYEGNAFEFLAGSALIDLAKRSGFDGIHAKEAGEWTWNAFYPEQIKSIFNRGTWSSTDGHISRSARRATEAFAPELISEYNVPVYKSREKLISMKIDDFLKMARDGRVQGKAEDVSNLRGRGSRFSSLPYLTTWPGDDGVLKVNGHEGRHRARQLKAEGFDEMPVILKANIRWSEQDSPGKFDYVKNWPTALEAEDSSERIPMPVSREQATQPYETEAMGVQFSTRPALASYLEGRNRTLSRANPQSVLESDIEKATQAINLAVREIKAGNKEQLEIPIGPVPHVLHMLGAPMQMLQIYTSVLRKVLVDKHSEDFAGVSAAEFVRAIYQPVAVLQERAKDEHEVLTNLTNAKGVPIVVALKADTVDLDGKTKTTTIKSAYSRDQMMAKGHLAAQLAAKKVKYADLAKVLELEEKSPTVAKAFGRAVPAKSATAVPLSKTERALPAPVGSDLLQQDRPGINLGSSSGTGLGSDRLGLSSASLFAKAVAKAINGGIIPGYGSLVQFLADQYQGAPADMPQFSIRNGNSAWDEPQANWFDDFVYKAQDKLIDLKRVIESIKKTVGQVTDDINAYLQEELFHGRAATRVRDFGKDELEPLMEEIKAQGLTMEQVEEFLHARHAKEANDLIRNRQGGMQDGGSGMTDADADAYMRSLSPSDLAKLNAVAVKVDSITATTRQLYADYGLESQDAVDAWAQMFQHYIPLYREDDGSMGIGQGFNVKGKEVKGRVGSTRRVVDVLGNIALQREKVIVRGEKNRVAQALVGLAQANPNPDFWDVRAQAPTEKVYDERTKKIIDRVLPNWKNQPNVLTAKVKNANGDVHEVAVEFNEDNERALRLAAALKNLDAGALEGLLGVSAKITRYFSSVNTQYNPVFGFVNVIRDVQAAMVNLAGTPLKGKQRRIAKDTLAAVAGIYSGARGGAGNQWTTLWKQFEEDGGSTGYRELFKSSADRAEALRNTLDPDAWMNSKWGKIFTAGGTLKVPMSAAKKGASWIFDWLSDYNEAMENGVRLATYKAALDQGLSRQEAASLAKNLTVNFNRKGQVGQQAGAVYAFFNAAMQGTARIGETIFTMDGGDLKTLRLSKTGQKVVYGGILLGSIQALALAAAGFSDDDPPDFVRERNLTIPIGDKKYLTIPMPLGLHVFPGLGRHAAEFAMGGFKDPTKRAASVFGMFADAFNPIGNAGMSLQTIAPTAIDPLVALSENKDWSGKPIARKSFNPAEPGYLQWKDSATGLSKSIAYGINWLTGGNDYKAGVISPTPDQIDFLIGQVTGGVGREISKIEQTTANLARGEEVAPYKLPLAGRLYGNAKSQASEGNAFYANSKRLNELETEIKLMEKDGKRQEAQELRKLPEAQLMRQANVIERQIQRLKKEKRELIDQGAERSAITAKDAAITDAMSRLNRSMERVKLAA